MDKHGILYKTEKYLWDKTMPRKQTTRYPTKFRSTLSLLKTYVSGTEFSVGIYALYNMYKTIWRAILKFIKVLKN